MPMTLDRSLVCGRCKGFLLTDQEETRCLNCGDRPYEKARAPEPPPQGRRRRCSNCQEDAVVGKHYCRRHLDYFAQYGRKQKAQRDEAAALREGWPCTD